MFASKKREANPTLSEMFASLTLSKEDEEETDKPDQTPFAEGLSGLYKRNGPIKTRKIKIETIKHKTPETSSSNIIDGMSRFHSAPNNNAPDAAKHVKAEQVKTAHTQVRHNTVQSLETEKPSGLNKRNGPVSPKKTETPETIDYNYTECGLSNVVIAGMPVTYDDEGDIIINIPRFDVLHASIMYELATKKSSLLSGELKFLRTEMGLSRSKLSDLIRKNSQTIERWEKGTVSIDATAEMLIRLLCFSYLEDINFMQSGEPEKVPNIQTLSQMCLRSENKESINFVVSCEGWYKRIMTSQNRNSSIS